MVDNTSDYESRGSCESNDLSCERSDMIIGKSNKLSYNDEEDEDEESAEKSRDNPIQYQNWIMDESEMERREVETDLYLKSLKKQNDEIQELIKHSEMVMEQADLMSNNKINQNEVRMLDDKNEFDIKFDKFFRKDSTIDEKSLRQTSKPKTNKDQTSNENNENGKTTKKLLPKNDATKTNNHLQQEQQQRHQQQQQKIPKIPTFNEVKKSIGSKASKQKFVATPMRHYKEYQEKDIPEIESWMSTNVSNEDQRENDKNHKYVSNKNHNNARADFTEVMDSLKELEEVFNNGDKHNDADHDDDGDDGNCTNDLPEHDKETQDTNVDDDDITSILEVLEAQDKKSRELINFDVLIKYP